MAILNESIRIDCVNAPEVRKTLKYATELGLTVQLSANGYWSTDTTAQYNESDETRRWCDSSRGAKSEPYTDSDQDGRFATIAKIGRDGITLKESFWNDCDECEQNKLYWPRNPDSRTRRAVVTVTLEGKRAAID